MLTYEKANAYDFSLIKDLIMGPNPLKLTEELLTDHRIPAGATVMDLGCGHGLTSVFLARDYGFWTFAVDLWITATENRRFFDRMGLTARQVVPIHADATALPFADAFFDAVVSVDAYHYFGLDPAYLGTHLLPLVRPGGYLYIAVPGMKRDCHDDLPAAFLASWTAEALETIHDAAYWTAVIRQTKGVEIVSIREMQGDAACWNDWLATDNPYAVGDRKAAEAGALDYMNFLAIVLRRA